MAERPGNGLDIDGFSNVEFVDGGGLGFVYRAVRTSTGGIVALKEVKAFVSGSPAWHRARREVEALVKLKGHPHVVSVEEILTGPNGPLLVMEYVDGCNVAQRLARGALAAAESLRIGLAVLSAIGAAHRAGIVHRDLKPHNVLLGSYGQVKVCDFGIAAIAREGGHTQTSASTLAYAKSRGSGRVRRDRPTGRRLLLQRDAHADAHRTTAVVRRAPGWPDVGGSRRTTG